MHPDYESELISFSHEEVDCDWCENDLSNASTEELKKTYEDHLEMLEKLRDEEPAKKRSKKEEYRFWIKITHDERDLLNDIAAELRRRNDLFKQ